MSRREFTDEETAELDRLEARGKEAWRECATAKDALEQCYERRKVILEAMLALGESKAGLARRFDVAPMTISFAVGAKRAPKKRGRVASGK